MIREAFIVTTLMLGLSACATVSRGSTDYLRVDSVPQGATVTTTMQTPKSRERSRKNILAKKEYIGCSPTPCAIEVRRSAKFAITIEHAGFKSAEIAIRGEIKQQDLNVNMATSMATNVAGGAAAGALVGTGIVVFAQTHVAIFNAVTYSVFNATANTGGIVAGATSTGTGVGVGLVAIDVMSGAYKSIYPNPIIVKLADENSPTVTDPNMLMFKIQQAKRKLKFDYCRENEKVSEKRRKRNCEIAKQMDAKRAIENAELLASEPEVVELIKSIKAEIKKQRKTQRAVQRVSTNNKPKDSK